MRKYICLILILSILIITLGISNSNQVQAANTYYQYVRTGIDQFPESYRARLNSLASKYPNWKFQAYYTGISWDDLIAKERDDSVHRNRVTVNAPASWRHCDFTDDGWMCASDAVVKYYLDPRNFLNDTQIFQFVETSYNEKTQTLPVIESSLKNTFLDNTITCKNLDNNMVTMSYAQIILDAAKRTNISAFYIKSKIIQEVGTWGSGSTSGNYPGHEGYYNFFNYGAYDDGDDVANGLNYAKEHDWDSQYKAIVGGAELIGKYYIAQGQNTAYFNKWDVVGTRILKDGESQTVNSSDMFWHQYMTNIQDPTSQSQSTRKLYENSLQSEITFIIPVYDNMPASNPLPQDKAVKGISLNKTNVEVGIDEKSYLTATITPADASNQDIVWTVSDPTVVRVWNNEFRGLKPGTAVITAKTVDGGYTATCRVTVRDLSNEIFVQSMNTLRDEYVIEVDEAVDVQYKYSPQNATNAEFYWTSSDDSVLRVFGNRFRGLKAGTAYVIATTLDGRFEKRVKVTVNSYVKEIKPAKEEYTAVVDEAVDIPYTYSPADSTNAEFYWSSSNDSIIRVWGNRFRALQPGTAYVIVRTLDGKYEKRIKVTVSTASASNLVKELKPEKEEYTANVDEAVDIPFTYTPSNASNAEFYWTSSDDSIIRVWGNRFRALKPGTAYVIATTLDGRYQKKIKVTVTSYVTQLIPEKEEYTSVVDEAVDIPFTYTPSNASNAEFYWTSSNDSVIRVWGNRFRALQPGTAYVIARTLDGRYEKRIKVIVH